MLEYEYASTDVNIVMMMFFELFLFMMKIIIITIFTSELAYSYSNVYKNTH